MKTRLLLLSFLGALLFVGAGCLVPEDQSFPPKPPVPGIQRSPAIDRLSPR